MKKVVQFLEMYVQWVALALGLAFLGYMIWAYVYKNPASQDVNIGGQQVSVTPGNVDTVINDGPATRLEQMTQQKHPEFVINVPPMTEVNINPTTQPVDLAGLTPADSWAVDPGKIFGTAERHGGALVDALPTLPALKYLDQEPLRTVLLITDPVNGQTSHKDQDSVTTFWSLSVEKLAQAFKAAFNGKLPQPKQLATFIRIRVNRQEIMANGQWGNDTLVPLPPLPPNTNPAPDYPANGNPQAQQKYQAWAAPLTQWFVNPPYPTVAFDQRTDLQWLPLAQWIPARAYAEAAENAPLNAPAPTPPPTPAPAPQQRGGFEGGPFGFGGPPPGRGGGGPGGGYGGGYGGYSAPQPRPQPQPQPQPVEQTPPPTTNPSVVVPPIPQLQPCPPSAFDPATQAGQGDMGVWFHDMTVQPGKTYRYQVSYTLLNPVFGQPALTAKPELAGILGIDSPFSDFSDKVIVPLRTLFWCADKQPANARNAVEPQVKFNTFNWHDGLWQQKDYICSPGDEIGADESATGNFTSHFTVLEDLRNEGGSRHNVLIVPDDGGPAQERDVETDEKSLAYLKFKRDFDNQATQQQQDQTQQPAAQLPVNGPPG